MPSLQRGQRSPRAGPVPGAAHVATAVTFRHGPFQAPFPSLMLQVGPARVTRGGWDRGTISVAGFKLPMESPQVAGVSWELRLSGHHGGARLPTPSPTEQHVGPAWHRPALVPARHAAELGRLQGGKPGAGTPSSSSEGNLGAPPSLPGLRFRREMPAARMEFQAVLSRRALALMERARLLCCQPPSPPCPAAPSCVDPHQHLPLPAETGLGTALAVQWPLLTGPHPFPLGTVWRGLPVAPCGAVHAPLPLCPHQHHLLPPQVSAHTVPTCLSASVTPDFTRLRGRNGVTMTPGSEAEGP